MVGQYKAAKSVDKRKEIYDFYLEILHRINNWNLVDISCYKIVGAYTYEVPKERKIFDELITHKV
jgi:3-methyladenine DNA glycosylase AlkD